MAVDLNEATVLRYQGDRLREKAAPKSINEEVRFPLKMVGSPAGDLIRSSLKEKKLLKLPVPKQIGKAFDSGRANSSRRKQRSLAVRICTLRTCWSVRKWKHLSRIHLHRSC